MSSTPRDSYDYPHTSTENPHCIDQLGFLSPSATVLAIAAASFTLGVLGLLLNVGMVYMSLRRRAATNLANAFLTTQLAAANIVVVLFNLVGDAAWKLTVRWLGGNILCKFVKYTQAFGLYAVGWMVAGMALERCISAFFPSRNGGHRPLRGWIIAAVVWLVAGSGAIPQATVFHVVKAPFCQDFYQCATFGSFLDVASARGYHSTYIAVAFVSPLVVTCICSVIVCISFASRKETPLVSPPGAGHKVDNHFANPSGGRQPAASRVERTVSWMTLCIALGFALCWAPYYALSSAHLFEWISDDAGDAATETMAILYLLGLSNVVLSPLVYGVFFWMNVRKGNTRSNHLASVAATVTSMEMK